MPVILVCCMMQIKGKQGENHSPYLILENMQKVTEWKNLTSLGCKRGLSICHCEESFSIYFTKKINHNCHTGSIYTRHLTVHYHSCEVSMCITRGTT